MDACCTVSDNVQETRKLISTLHGLTAEIETLRSQMGRLPRDEAELVALRGRPMPPSHFGHGLISYQRDAGRDGLDGDYHLECMASHFWGCHWDIFGWIILYYGPNASRRFHVEPF